jgi:predicted nucleic acid-binding protein
VAVLDASALIAALTDEPARDEVESILNDPDARVNAINVVEVYDRLIRTGSQTRESVDELFGTLRRVQSLTVVSLDEGLAARAGELRATHYHRLNRPVSNADCVALATAEALDASLATTDPRLAAMARDEGVEVIALPDSSGTRP